MNKKTYIVPMTTTFTVHVESHLLEASIIIDGTKSATSTKGGWAKENRTYRDYNVWDDDWSN